MKDCSCSCCCCWYLAPDRCTVGIVSFQISKPAAGALSLRLQRPRRRNASPPMASPRCERDDGGVASPNCLIAAHGWRVRDVNPSKQKDLYNIARIQANAFHQTSPVFNDLLYDLFKAEVLSALSYKVRLSPPRRYTCLVAETERDDMVGVVDLTALSNREVLKHLHDADEYLYVSGLAVEQDYRRRNVATTLLRGADLRAADWDFNYLVLHAYEDDVGARKVYSNSGYKAIALDPAWSTTWIGRKRRVIMAKRVPPQS